MVKNFALYTFFCLLLLYSNLTPISREVKGATSYITSPLSFAFYSTYTGINEALVIFTKLKHIQQENAYLKEKLQQKESELAEIKKSISSTEFTREQEEVCSLGQSTNLIDANIIGKKYIQGQSLLITLNKGNKDNVKKDSTVCYNGYLVGIITNSTPTSSEVLTLQNNISAIPVETLDSGTSGLYKCENDVCAVIQINNADELNKSEIVITSGIDGKYKKGLILGHVEQIESTPQGVFKQAKLFSPLDLEKISKVVVISNAD